MLCVKKLTFCNSVLNIDVVHAVDLVEVVDVFDEVSLADCFALGIQKLNGVLVSFVSH